MRNFLKSVWQELTRGRSAEPPEEEPINLTPRARQALDLARQEAERLNHTVLDTEHVLLGMIGLGAGMACNVLRNMGIALDTLRQTIEEQLPPQTASTGATPIPLSPAVERVLGLAQQESVLLSHTYTGTEHLLLGLIREGLAGRVLQSLQVHVARTRREILRELEGRPPSQTTDKTAAEEGPCIDV